MRKLFFLLLLAITSHALLAQNLVQLEYAFDQDRGFGKNTIVNFPPTNNTTISFQASVDGIEDGRHILYVRVRDDRGLWSQTMRHGVDVSRTTPNKTVVAVEYFFDVDPGYAKANRQTFNVPAGDGEFVLTIPRDLVLEGTQNLYLRVIDSDDRISHTQVITRDFEVEACLVPAQPDPIENSNACTVSPATFTVPAVTNANSYQWVVPAAVQIVSGQGTATVSLQFPGVTTPTDYSISVAAVNDCGTGEARSFTVTAEPALLPSIAINASSTNACAGSLITFTATAANVGASPVYQWKVNGVDAGTNSNTFSSTSIADGDQVTCDVTSSLDCVSPGTVSSNTIQVDIVAAIAPSISINASATSICAGTNVTFTATSSNAGANPTYQWKVNGMAVGTNSNTFSSSSLSDGDQVTCEVTSSLACASPQSATSNSIQITYLPAMVPTVTISASATSICAGMNITFTANATNGGANPVYQWKVNGIAAGSNSNMFSSNSLNNGDQVTCELTSSLACASPGTVTSNSIQITHQPPVVPTITIAGTPTNICPGTNVTFTANVTNEGANPIYQWKVNGVAVGANLPTYSSTTLNDGDEVLCELRSSAACAPNTPVASNIITIDVGQGVGGTIVISGSTSVVFGDYTQLATQLTNVNGAHALQWQDSTSNHGWRDIAGATHATINYSPAENGDRVRCVLTSISSCDRIVESISNELVFTILLPGNMVRAFPNPTDGILRVDRLSPDDQWKSLELANSIGQVVLGSTNISGQGSVQLDIRHLAPGLYFIRLTRDSGDKKIIKIIKQ